LPATVGLEIARQNREIFRVRLDRDDMAVRMLGEEACRRVSDIRAAIDDQPGLRKVIEASVFAFAECLREYVDVRRVQSHAYGMRHPQRLHPELGLAAAERFVNAALQGGPPAGCPRQGTESAPPTAHATQERAAPRRIRCE
jgi:hypothetical protein